MALQWEIEWMTATKKEETRSRRIRKKIFGIPYIGTHSKTFPERHYDTRRGDSIPKHVHEFQRRLRASVDINQVYLYLGDEVEVPNFNHIRTGRSLSITRKLQYAVITSDGITAEIPASSVEIKYDSTVTQPSAVITCFQEAGLFVFDGLQDFQATLTFRDEEQRKQYTKEMAPEVRSEQAA